MEVMSQLVGSQREIQAANQNKLLPARQEAAVLCSLSLLTEPCGQCWLPWFLSEWGYPPEFSDDVGQPFGQPAPARLLHMERSGQQVVEGAVAHGHHGAGEADDIVGHAEVWCWQVHQQRLRVQAHKIAGAIRGRKPGEWKKERGVSLHRTAASCSPDRMRAATARRLWHSPAPSTSTLTAR